MMRSLFSWSVVALCASTSLLACSDDDTPNDAGGAAPGAGASASPSAGSGGSGQSASGGSPPSGASGSASLADAGAGGSGGVESPEAAFADRLLGSFSRVAPVDAPGGGTAYLRQTVTFTGPPDALIEGLSTEAFLDEALTESIFLYESAGPCIVLGLSAAVAGAFEVNLTNDTSQLTINTEDDALVAALGFDDCNLELGVRGDVSNGCAGPTLNVAACVDQDIFALSDEDRLFSWGDETVDHCLMRPQALAPVPFERDL